MSEIMAYAIDYGTSNSLLRPIYKEKNLRLADEAPDSEMKSILFCDDEFQWSFGDQAVNEYTMNPLSGRIFKSLKRFLPDPSFTGTQIFGKFLNLHDIVSMQLKYMREKANSYYGQEVNSTVLGHPALFHADIESHKLALTRLTAAATTAGFKTIKLCPEPLAAAFHYRRSIQKEKLILVADLGGGTSDFTICRLSPNSFSHRDVLALHGLPTAGDKFDSAIMKQKIAPYYGSKIRYKLPMGSNWLSLPITFIDKLTRPADIMMLSSSESYAFIEEAQRYASSSDDKNALDLLLSLVDERLGYALFREIENAKISLSKKTATPLTFAPFGSKHFEQTLVASDFTSFTQPIVQEILNCLDETLSQAQLSAKFIDHVFVTGGTSQIPAIQQQLKQRFGERLETGKIFQSVVEGLVSHGETVFMPSLV